MEVKLYTIWAKIILSKKFLLNYSKSILNYML
jgi:hypothetical protein